MSNAELAVANGNLAIRDQHFWTPEQRAALATLGIRNASNADLAVFLHYCQKTQLDPFARQIYGIMRREKIGDDWVDKFTIQVGIDGFRVIRDRVAARLGVTVEYEDTIWYDADGSEHGVWLREDAPVACKVVVLKNGRRFPAVVRTASYIATNRDGRPVSQWRTQPDHMIEKCAEAFALRRAFPNDLGGLYVPEELPPEPPRDIARLADGRLDQAQMTEGEKWDAGLMDRRARVEHDALVRAAAETPGEHERTIVVDPEAADTPEPAHPSDKPASRAAVGRLQRLLREVPLGEAEDVAALLSWITGKPRFVEGELTGHDVKVVTTYLGDLLEATDDPEKAAEQAWQQFRQANPQAADDGA